MKLFTFISTVAVLCATVTILTTVTASEGVYDEHDSLITEQDSLHTEDDIVAAESQDSEVRVHAHSDTDGELQANRDDRPRTRSRNRNGKRRRRLRKRPRTTTPSFLEVYEEQNHEEFISPAHEHIDFQTAKEEDEEDVSYKRRRPSKRRRRPTRPPQYVDNDDTLDPPHSYSTDQTNGDKVYNRNGQRRRRKGSGRKRMRNNQYIMSVMTEDRQVQGNQTEITPENNTEVGPQSRIKPSRYEGLYPFEPLNHQGHHQESEIVHSTVPTILMTSSAFTPSEITEINHKLQPLPLGQQSYNNENKVPDKKYYNVFDTADTLFSSTLSSVQSNRISAKTEPLKDQNLVTMPSLVKYSNLHTITDQTLPPTNTNTAVVYGNRLSMPISHNNIEKILENRKNLFSTSKRLPPTSTVIRRLRPTLHRNSSSTVPSNSDISNPLTSPMNLKLNRKECDSVNCTTQTTITNKNEESPNTHLPASFIVLPEVISSQHILDKVANESNEYILNKTEVKAMQPTTMTVTTLTSSSSSLSSSSSSSTTTSTTPVTSTKTISRPPEIMSPTSVTMTSMSPVTMKSPVNTTTTTMVPTTTSAQTATTLVTKSPATSSKTSLPPRTMLTTLTAYITTAAHSQNPSKNVETQEMKTAYQRDVENHFKKNASVTSGKTDNLKLTNLTIPNVEDDIVDLLKTESGKARVSRILELRNMTLNDLLEHRERGSSQLHLAEIFPNSKPEPNDSSVKLNIFSSQRTLRIQSVNKQEYEGNLKTSVNTKAYNSQNSTENLNQNKQGQKFSTEINHDINKPAIVIPSPTLTVTQNTFIQFPDDGILGAFPKFISDTLNGKHSSENKLNSNSSEHKQEDQSVDRHGKNTPILYNQYTDQREPRIFDSMPQFDSNMHTKNKNNFKIPPYPDWNILLNQNVETSTGINNVINLHNEAPKKTETEKTNDVIFLNDGDESYRVRNHILGGKISAESGNTDDNDYPQRRSFPENAKSTLAVSIAILGLAIFGFLSVLVSCRIQQRRTQLRAKSGILCQHLHGDDLHSSQHSLNPVLKRTSAQNIQSNTSSNRHYYLWRTLRKTFQYE